MKDLADLSKLAREHYLTHIKEQFGQPGIDAVRSLHPYLKDIFSAIDYDSIQESLTVFKMVGADACPMDLSVATVLEVPDEIAALNTGSLTILLTEDDHLTVWPTSVHPSSLPPSSVIYHYSPAIGERFWVNGVESGSPWSRRYPLFGLPLFNDLQSALQRYSTTVARSSECPELSNAWREPGRVMWRAGPEFRMRRSLYYYLRNTLRDGRPDVHQEAPADDKNPVDITVRWADSNRIGVIEIKWLGKSGNSEPLAITTEWSEKRAQDGLQQLVDYLELTRARAPLHDRRGYLVILDGRRARTKAETTTCSREDGMAFANRHITYDQQLLSRHDIAAPVRCFCEPNWVHQSPSRAASSRSDANK